MKLNNSSVMIAVVSLVGTSVLVTGTLSINKLYRAIASSAPIIEHAPINTNKPSPFVWLTGSFEDHLLEDTALPVSCDGHRLLRIVQQYVKTPGQNTITPVAVPAELSQNNTHFPFHSLKIVPSKQNMHGVNVPSSVLEERFYETHSEFMEIKGTLPKHIQQIDKTIFFIGKHPSSPQENNIMIEYACQRLKPMTLWGSVNEDGMLEDSYIGSGMSTLSVQQQKKSLAESLYYSGQSLLSVGAMIGLLITLCIIKIVHEIYPFVRLKILLRIVKRYQLWFMLPIVFVPNSLSMAFLLGCLGTFYFGMLRVLGLLSLS